jgi:biotin carboxyl carrier protein
LQYRLEILNQAFEVDVVSKPNGSGYKISIDGQWFDSAQLELLPIKITKISDNNNNNDYQIEIKNRSIDVHLHTLNFPDESEDSRDSIQARDIFTPEGHLIAPMPGKIVSVKCKIGDKINKGDLLLVFEAMKMENEIISPISGKVIRIDVKPGDAILANQILIQIEKSL